MSDAFVEFAKWIAIIGVLATAAQLISDHFKGQFNYVSVKDLFLIVILSPILGWLLIVSRIYDFFVILIYYYERRNKHNG